MLGMKVMIDQLCGNQKSLDIYEKSVGKTIDKIVLGNDDAVHIVFSDGAKIKIFDDGQSCCESRYMRTDDTLSGLEGNKFLGLEIKDGPSTETEYGESHDVQFLEIKTNKGSAVMSSHNEHNGHYGGFSIALAEE